jgi:hypothetical protein
MQVRAIDFAVDVIDFAPSVISAHNSKEAEKIKRMTDQDWLRVENVLKQNGILNTRCTDADKEAWFLHGLLWATKTDVLRNVPEGEEQKVSRQCKDSYLTLLNDLVKLKRDLKNKELTPKKPLNFIA